MDEGRFGSSSMVGAIGARHGARWSVASLVATLLAACGAPYAPQPWPAEHPASPQAAEAPSPERSRALSAQQAPSSAEGGGEGDRAHHGGRR